LKSFGPGKPPPGKFEGSPGPEEPPDPDAKQSGILNEPILLKKEQINTTITENNGKIKNKKNKKSNKDITHLFML